MDSAVRQSDGTDGGGSYLASRDEPDGMSMVHILIPAAFSLYSLVIPAAHAQESLFQVERAAAALPPKQSAATKGKLLERAASFDAQNPAEKPPDELGVPAADTAADADAGAEPLSRRRKRRPSIADPTDILGTYMAKHEENEESKDAENGGFTLDLEAKELAMLRRRMSETDLLSPEKSLKPDAGKPHREGEQGGLGKEVGEARNRTTLGGLPRDSAMMLSIS